MSEDVREEIEEVREQDRYLPIANISRIMKKSLPANAKIAKDAKETVQECVSEFISFITSEGEGRRVMGGQSCQYLPGHVWGVFIFMRCFLYHSSTASEKCQQEKRKTINGDDLLWAMSTLGFDKYVEPLKIYLAKYREVRLTEGIVYVFLLSNLEIKLSCHLSLYFSCCGGVGGSIYSL